jgi:hypothetical protein
MDWDEVLKMPKAEAFRWLDLFTPLGSHLTLVDADSAREP